MKHRIPKLNFQNRKQPHYGRTHYSPRFWYQLPRVKSAQGTFANTFRVFDLGGGLKAALVKVFSKDWGDEGPTYVWLQMGAREKHRSLAARARYAVDNNTGDRTAYSLIKSMGLLAAVEGKGVVQ